MPYGSDANQRLDHAAIVDFLTSTAGVLATAGLIGTKETDDLRFALSGIGGGSDRSLLVELEVQHAEFLGLLTTRYGSVGLCLNLLRHTLRGSLRETLEQLTGFGQALIKKAELMFNRPFFIYRGSHCQKQTLFSAVIVDFAETLERSCEVLEETLQSLARMNPNELAAATDADYQLDLAIAKALGFDGLVACALPVQSEAECKRQLTQALTMVGDGASQLAEQLAANTGEELAHDVLAACETLKAECQRLHLLEFPRSESLLVWEVRRRHLTACVGALNSAIVEVRRATLSAIAPDLGKRRQPLPDAVRRRLAYDLIVTGVTPIKAHEAVQELLGYLEVNRIDASAVLPAELGRIHAQLSTKTLATLRLLAEDASLMTMAATAKSATMARVVRLGQSFQQTAGRLVVPGLALLATLLLTACGLKTRPTSSIAELRPDVPFHVEAPPSKPVDAVRTDKDTQGAHPRAPGANLYDGNPQKQP